MIINKLKDRTINSTKHVGSYHEYEQLVKKLLKLHAPNLSYNDDVIAYLITEVGLADCRYDDTKGMTRSSFRILTVKLKIQSLRKQSRKKSMTFSINVENDKETTIADIIPSSELEPIDILIKQEENEGFQKMLDNSNLTKKERKFLEMYFLNGMTLREIGASNATTHQNVQAKIKNSLKKLKTYLLSQP